MERKTLHIERDMPRRPGADGLAWGLLVAICLAGGRAEAQTPNCGAGTGSAITVTNLRSGDTLPHELALLKGKVAAGAGTVTLVQEGVRRSWPVADGNFKALGHLKEGRNTLALEAAGHKTACLEIEYLPRHLGANVQVIVVAGKEVQEGPGMIPALPGEPSDLASVKKRVSLTALLAQAGMAELLARAGKPRRTFGIARDALGGVDVHLWRSPLTTAELVAARKRDEKFMVPVSQAIRAKYGISGQNFLLYVVSGDPWPAALGEFAWVPGANLHTHAQDLGELVARLSDKRSPALLGLPTSQTAENTFHSDKFWTDYAANIGATMHELGHSFGLPHSGTDDDVMRVGNYRANQLFMVQDEGKTIVRENIEWGDTSRTILMQSMHMRGPLTFALRPDAAPGAVKPGLRCDYHEGIWNTVPDFGPLTPKWSGVSPGVAISVQQRADNFALRFDGMLDIPADGEYAFTSYTDDAGKMFLGDSLILDRRVGIGYFVRSANIGLKAGRYRFRFEYLQQAGQQGLTLEMEGKGMPRGPIPTDLLSHSAETIAIRTGPVPALVHRAGRSLSFTLPRATRVSLDAYSPAGRSLGALHAGSLPAGENRIVIPASLPPGSLVMMRMEGGQRSFVLP